MRINYHGCFVEDMKNDCCLVAKGNKNGTRFTRDAKIPKMSVALFEHGKGVVAYIDIQHKLISHVNI